MTTATIGRAALHLGDCRDTMRRLIADRVTVHAVVTDPPYGLTSIVSRFGADGAAPAKSDGATGVYGRAARGFMGQTWDGSGIERDPEMWRLCWELLPPGGHLAAFGGCRTWHRIAVAIEDAGFEIRDSLCWLFGTGFPKSHNPGAQMDQDWWDETELEHGMCSHRAAHYEGHGTALKPGWEPIIVGRKPLEGTVAENLIRYGVGALNIDGCRIEAADKTSAPVGQFRGSNIGPTGLRGVRDGASDALGRWPANVVHDGSEEVETAFAAFGADKGAAAPVRGSERSPASRGRVTGQRARVAGAFHGDIGTASRFFYCAKATQADRGEGNDHPTVKPEPLMRWLNRMFCPVGGTILDPFTGSGSTGKAALLEGFGFIGCEQSPEYFETAKRRVAEPAGVPVEKARPAPASVDDLALFAWSAAQ